MDESLQIVTDGIKEAGHRTREVIHGGDEKESQNGKDQAVFDDILTGLIAEEVRGKGRVHANLLF
jgi:hypothetical protein